VNICLLNLFPAVMSFNLRKAIREEENRIAYEAKAQFMGDEMPRAVRNDASARAEVRPSLSSKNPAGSR